MEKWTPEEVATLRRFAGGLMSEAVAALNRGYRSVQRKAQREKLTFLHGNAGRTPANAGKPRGWTPKPKPSRVVVQVSPIEYCGECRGCPVSNWAEHFERTGHRRPWGVA